MHLHPQPHHHPPPPPPPTCLDLMNRTTSLVAPPLHKEEGVAVKGLAHETRLLPGVLHHHVGNAILYNQYW